MNLSVKEIIIGATAITSLGLGVMNFISGKKAKGRDVELQNQINAINVRLYPQAPDPQSIVE